MKKALHELDRLPWNTATITHNRHKGDRAAFFRNGGSTLFPETPERPGERAGLRLSHRRCDAGPDTLPRLPPMNAIAARRVAA
ncbi:hypothetical protein ACVBGC_19815 [Burkholderia stagnalis]